MKLPPLTPGTIVYFVDGYDVDYRVVESQTGRDVKLAATIVRNLPERFIDRAQCHMTETAARLALSRKLRTLRFTQRLAA